MYVKIVNNQPSVFPYTLSDLQRDNPQTSFPSVCTDSLLELFSVYKVQTTPAPVIDSKTHRIKQTVQKIDDVWTQAWIVVEISLDQASNNVRGYRDRLLSECDWTHLPAISIDKVAWATYRQELRDITDQEGFPYNLIWPIKPA